MQHVQQERRSTPGTRASSPGAVKAEVASSTLTTNGGKETVIVGELWFEFCDILDCVDL